MTSTHNKFFIIIFFVFLYIVCGCAEIVAPPGGEIDSKGPFLVSSNPANQSVNVEIGNKIELIFSEDLSDLPKNKGIFISPLSIIEPKIKLKSNRIIITLADNFQENQTYVISLSLDIKDQRNNPLDSTNVIAFSTGPMIESNFLSGFVYDDKTQPLSNVLVGLFEPTDFSTIINYDSTSPIYLTQVDKNGKFEFRYLSKKNYQLIAYEDYNKNKFFNPKKERFAVTDRPINFDSEDRLDRLSMNLTKKTPSEIKILSVGLNTDNLIRLTLSGEVDSYYFENHPENISMMNLIDTSIILYGTGIIINDNQYTSELVFYVPDITEGNYFVKLYYSDDAQPAIFEKCTIKPSLDKINPTIIHVSPSETNIFPEDLMPKISFSEPIDTSKITAETFSFWNKDSSDKVEIGISWPNLLNVLIIPKKVNDGSKYLLKMTEFEIGDLSGNLIGDSLREYNFQTIDNDSLGEISGRINIKLAQKAEEDIILEFIAISTQKKYYLSADDEIFKIKVPSGNYLLRGFVDNNKNRVFDKGSVNPYTYSETSNFYLDTIRVRARFETSDIDFIIE